MSTAKKYGAFPPQTRPCPHCKGPVVSAIVYSLDRPARGINFTVHRCLICGTAVNRIVGCNIGSPRPSDADLIVEPVSSQQEIEAICVAAGVDEWL